MSDVIELFKDPPKEYRIQPFWFLNRGFDEQELRRQIAEMDDKGVGGAILHCRHGLSVEYMSDEWLDMIAVCIDEMKKRGMEAWLYDEDDWPSGTVGGRLTQTAPGVPHAVPASAGDAHQRGCHLPDPAAAG